MSRHNRTVLAFLFVFIILGAAALAANGVGWTIFITSPQANTTFSPGAPIGVYKGTTSWPKGSDSIDMVAMYTLTGGTNPFTAVNVSSNYANYTKNQNQDGSGTGTFNSQNVTPPLLAPSTPSTTFYVVGIPENAASGAYLINGNPFGDAVKEKTTN